jgi:hypothetical protein
MVGGREKREVSRHSICVSKKKRIGVGNDESGMRGVGIEDRGLKSI